MADLAAIRHLLDGRVRADSGTTHWGTCHHSHIGCAARWLLGRVEALEAYQEADDV